MSDDAEWMKHCGEQAADLELARKDVFRIERLRLRQAVEIEKLEAQLRRCITEFANDSNPPMDGRRCRIWTGSHVVWWDESQLRWCSDDPLMDADHHVFCCGGWMVEPPPKEEA